MTQPYPPESADAPTMCTAYRATSDTTAWWQGVAHLRHQCILPGPHPTHPHSCMCTVAWPQVDIVMCVQCRNVRSIDELVASATDYDTPALPAYRCRDRARCVRRPVESESDGSGVGHPALGHENSPSVRVAAAAGILRELTRVIAEHRGRLNPTAPPWQTILSAIADARRELRNVLADLAREATQ